MVIPLRDENPTRRFPVVTVLLIAVNVGIYFLIQNGGLEFTAASSPAAQQEREIDQLRFNFEHAAVPDEIVDLEPLTVQEVAETIGARPADVAAVICDGDPRRLGDRCFPDKQPWLAILYSIFLHGSLLHLGGNMLFLWIFGNNIEDHLGVPRYLAFYLAAGAVACLAHVLIQPDSTVPMLGASGAIAGVMGAYLVWFPQARIHTLVMFFIVDIAAMWVLGFWFVSQFFVNPNSGVAWMAHVGGFVFGVLVGLLVRSSRTARRAVWRSAGTWQDDWR